MSQPNVPPRLLDALGSKLPVWAAELGFQQLGVVVGDLSQYENRLNSWLARDFHGEMSYMAHHGTRRSRPAELVEGTTRVITVRMNYLRSDAILVTDNPQAYVAQYAHGRDYHKLIRQRLQKLINRMAAFLEEHGIEAHAYRAFTDSAPVLEKPLAEQAGLGWIGKNTLLINQHAGSWFFLGEIYTNLPLPLSNAQAQSLRLMHGLHRCLPHRRNCCTL